MGGSRSHAPAFPLRLIDTAPISFYPVWVDVSPSSRAASMKKRVRRILLGSAAACLAVLLATGGLAAYLYTHPARLLPLLLARFERSTGLLLSADTFFLDKPSFNRFRLKGRRVSLRESKTLAEVLSADDFSLVLDLSRLLSGLLVVESLKTDGLSAAVTLGGDGRVSLGGWVLPKKAPRRAQKPALRVEDMDIARGALSLRFPARLGIGTVEITELAARAEPEAGGGRFSASARVSRAGKGGLVKADGRKTAGAWMLKVTGAGLPLTGLVAPGDGGDVPDMPLTALIDLSGSISVEDRGPVRAWIAVASRNAGLGNPKVPGGRIAVSELSGLVSLSSDPKAGVRLGADIRSLDLPFSRLAGRLAYASGPETPASFDMSVRSTDLFWDSLKGYLRGFIPPHTADFLEKNITRALCRNVTLALNWTQKPPRGRPAVTLLASTRAEHLAMTFDSPWITPASEVSADVTFRADGMTADILGASGRGCQVTGGKVDIIYNLPHATPLSFTLKGRVDTGLAWPWMRAAIESEGFVKNLALSGPADAEVSWSWKDIDTAGSDTYLVKVAARGMGARFEDAAHPLVFSGVSGGVTVDPRAVAFAALYASRGPVRALLNGDVALSDGGGFSLGVNLDHLETLLPAFSEPGHPLSGWRPRALSGRVTVARAAPSEGPKPITAALSTRDEAGRTFLAEAEFSPSLWAISRMSGAMGGLGISGAAGPQTGNIHLTAQVPRRRPYDVRLAWKSGRARADVTGPEFLLDDFIVPLLPESLSQILAWTAAQPGSKTHAPKPFSRIDFSVATPRLRLTRDLAGPAEATGSIDLKDGGSVRVDRLTVNGHTASLLYRDLPDKTSLAVTIDRESASNLAALAAQALSPAAARGAPSGPSKPLALSLSVGRLSISGHKPEPLSADILIEKPGGRFRGRGQIRLGPRTVSAQAAETPSGLGVSARADRLDADLAGAILALASPPATAPAAPAPVTRVDFSLDVADFSLSPALHGPLSAAGGVALPSRPGAGRTELTLKKLAFLGQECHGSFSSDPGRTRRLSLDFSRLDLGRVRALAPAAAAAFPQADAGVPLPLEFSISAREALVPQKGPQPLRLAGTVTAGRDRLNLLVSQAVLGRQKGSGRLSGGKGDYTAEAAFDFLDLDVLRALLWPPPPAAPGKARTAAPKAPQKAAPPAGVRVAVPLDLPKISLRAVLKAARFDCGKRGVLESALLSGMLSPDRITVTEASWKKGGAEAFRLSGTLVRRSERLWRGEAAADFADMGDVAAVLFPPQGPDGEKFPVSGGRTHAKATADLSPAPDGLWVPRGSLSFESKEGQINKGGPLIFVLGALSPFNYARALAGKRTELSGEGVVFKVMDGAADFTGGLFTITKFSFQSPSLRYLASGTVNIETDRQDLTVCVQPFGTINRIISFTPGLNLLLQNKDGAIIESCFQAVGPMASPKVTTIPQSMVPTRLGDLFRRK